MASQTRTLYAFSVFKIHCPELFVLRHTVTLQSIITILELASNLPSNQLQNCNTYLQGVSTSPTHLPVQHTTLYTISSVAVLEYWLVIEAYYDYQDGWTYLLPKFRSSYWMLFHQLPVRQLHWNSLLIILKLIYSNYRQSETVDSAVNTMSLYAFLSIDSVSSGTVET